MPNRNIIRNRLAFFLLVVFALSTTPKVLFHDALAHHQDGLQCQEHDRSKPCFHRQAYHCQFDDLVVTSPYLSLSHEQPPIAPAIFTRHNVPLTTQIHSSFLLHTEGRGPPAV